MKYQHFTIEEREKIQEYIWDKKSVREMAKTLDRSPSSVSREIKRHFNREINKYSPRSAHGKALKSRHLRGKSKRLKNDKIREYVTTHLKKHWSPEQIAGKIK